MISLLSQCYFLWLHRPINPTAVEGKVESVACQVRGGLLGGEGLSPALKGEDVKSE
jgi:hypothetical protein